MAKLETNKKIKEKQNTDRSQCQTATFCISCQATLSTGRAVIISDAKAFIAMLSVGHRLGSKKPFGIGDADLAMANSSRKELIWPAWMPWVLQSWEAGVIVLYYIYIYAVHLSLYANPQAKHKCIKLC